MNETELMRNKINEVYRERAMLVPVLASIYPSRVSPGQENDEWPVVHINGPTGQMGWHIAPEDLELFDHVSRGENEWDGHDTQEKFKRLLEIIKVQK